jgi:hypothetical protein
MNDGSIHIENAKKIAGTANNGYSRAYLSRSDVIDDTPAVYFSGRESGTSNSGLFLLFSLLGQLVVDRLGHIP